MQLSRRALSCLPFMAGIIGMPARAAMHDSGEPDARGYAKGPFGLIHYRDTGKGVPLVLLHQSPMSSQQFETVYPLFAAKGIRAIGIDMPGFGLSDPTDFTPTAKDWAKIVPAVLDHLGIEKAHIGGHHTGGAVAIAAASLFPERTSSLIIHAALLVTEEERAKRLERVTTGERGFVYKEDGSHLTDTYRGRYKLYGEGADPKLITRYVIERFLGTGESWYGHHVAYEYNSTEGLKNMKARTLVLGNSGDMVIEITRRIKTLRPDVAYVELEGGGVDIVDQQPQVWVDAIHRFINA
ncbi:MAG: alpha/beta hydrolase [Rhodobacteraceae bacterium]|nr:alpha/beta hydrolase [Paracoccaceae bacterium]